MSSAPLRHNRDFALLQAGQLLSTLGSGATTIAYPLLVLAVIHSPAAAGLVASVRILPQPILSLAAGVLVDRADRRRLMIGADLLRGLALAALAASVASGHVRVWQIASVAFVEGAGSVVFLAAQTGALRAVVPTPQLPDAAGAQEARQAVARVGAPPLGGALFGVGHAVPFVADAVSYAASIAALAAMRTPFQEQRERARTPLRTQLAEGVAFLWRHPFLRASTLLYAVGNVTIPGLLLVVVVVGAREGLTAAEIGLLTAAFGAATLIGALASPLVRRVLAIRTIMWLEFWSALAVVLFLAWPKAVVLAAAMLPQALMLPVTDSVVHGYRIAITPDHVLGRAESVRRTLALAAAPVGPLAAGALLDSTSARAAVAGFAAIALALAVWGTLSPAIRNAPSLSELR